MIEGTFEDFYPDVLGAISGGVRVSLGAMQCALGIFPRQAYLNQPIEAVLLMQNMVDQPMQVKVSVNLPETDGKLRPIVLDTPKNVISLSMDAGEVGLLRIPIIAFPPTSPSTDIPVNVAVRFRTPKPGQAVRPPAGGAPPSILTVSQYKLQALREVEFVARAWNDSTDIITAYFDIMPKRLPPVQQTFTPRYETLWTHANVTEERQLVLSKVEEARKIAKLLISNEVYPQMIYAVEQAFMTRGMPLEPGEIKAIAKLVSYTLSDAYTIEANFSLENSRWFKTLCHALAHDPKIAKWQPQELAARYLFEPALYDSVLLGFKVIQPRVRVNLGNKEERLSYADKLMTWFGGQGEPDLNYVYLPFVLSGVALNMLVGMTIENPWIMLDQLHQSFARRRRMIKAESQPIFDMLEKLLERAQDDLVRAHVPEP